METTPQALIGFRSWDVSDTGYLFSTGIGHTAWRPGVNVMSCAQHISPDQGCQCGYYALYKPDWKKSWGGSVLGVVAAKGVVQKHEDGFRAEEVQIIALYQASEKLAKLYGVPNFSCAKELLSYAQSCGVILEDQVIEEKSGDQSENQNQTGRSDGSGRRFIFEWSSVSQKTRYRENLQRQQ